MNKDEHCVQLCWEKLYSTVNGHKIQANEGFTKGKHAVFELNFVNTICNWFSLVYLMNILYSWYLHL